MSTTAERRSKMVSEGRHAHWRWFSVFISLFKFAAQRGDDYTIAPSMGHSSERHAGPSCRRANKWRQGPMRMPAL